MEVVMEYKPKNWWEKEPQNNWWEKQKIENNSKMDQFDSDDSEESKREESKREESERKKWMDLHGALGQ